MERESLGTRSRETLSAPSPAERWLQWLLLALIFALPFMQPTIPLFGFVAIPADFLFVALGGAWIWLWPPGARLSSSTVSMSFRLVPAGDAGLRGRRRGPFASAAKLATQLYLLSLPVIVCSLVRDQTARCAARFWPGSRARPWWRSSVWSV